MSPGPVCAARAEEAEAMGADKSRVRGQGANWLDASDGEGMEPAH